MMFRVTLSVLIFAIVCSRSCESRYVTECYGALNTDVLGDELKVHLSESIAQPNKTWDDCCDYCTKRHVCLGWVHTNDNGGKCDFKKSESGIVYFKPKQGVTSGYLKFF